jgi:arsenical pump membrane protein
LPALAGGLVTYAALRVMFRGVLDATATATATASASPSASGSGSAGAGTHTRARARVLLGLLVTVLSYPVVSWFGGPVWVVAVCGAAVLLGLASKAGHRPVAVLREEVHLDVLLFLVAVLVLSLGLRNVGVVGHLSHAYDGASPLRIGILSAAGSAVLNNHPMANLNMLALVPGGATADPRSVLAALVGGDLGPRLFPMGSLAGLLWLEMLRRSGVEVSVRKFVLVGVVATVPALFVCLALL